MIAYNGSDVRRINHSLKVTAFATLIAELEGCSPDIVERTAVAAILHDIGIHAAEANHGSTAGKYQELEGPAIASQLLDEIDAPDALKERVCFIVGHHHTLGAIDGLDFQILVEADCLVNAYEDQLSPEGIQSMRRKAFRTKSGSLLFDTMYTEGALEGPSE
jgi:predicted HD phosphohydrolase